MINLLKEFEISPTFVLSFSDDVREKQGLFGTLKTRNERVLRLELNGLPSPLAFMSILLLTPSPMFRGRLYSSPTSRGRDVLFGKTEDKMFLSLPVERGQEWVKKSIIKGLRIFTYLLFLSKFTAKRALNDHLLITLKPTKVNWKIIREDPSEEWQLYDLKEDWSEIKASSNRLVGYLIELFKEKLMEC